MKRWLMFLVMASICASGCGRKEKAAEAPAEVQMVAEAVVNEAQDDSDIEDDLVLDEVAKEYACPVPEKYAFDKSQLIKGKVNCERGDYGWSGAVVDWVRGNNRFSLKLLQTQADKDAMVSGYSLERALGAMMDGACGDTYHEMRNVLEMPNVAELSALGAEVDANMLKKDLEKPVLAGVGFNGEPPVYVSDNMLWVDRSLTVRREFRRLFSQYYDGQMASVDFANDLPNVVSSINEHVNCATKGLISEICQESDFDSEYTKLVLTNSVYFKGQWKIPFAEGSTKKSAFYTDEGMKQVDMMYTETLTEVLINEDYAAVRLPFGSNDTGYSMIAFLPILKDGETPNAALRRVEQVINVKTFERFLCQGWMSPRKSRLEQESCLGKKPYPKYVVRLSMPKFKTEHSMDLNETLKDMGMISAFQGADFKFLHGDPGGLQITLVRQKTFIDLNEKGVEAGAVTLVMGAGGGMPMLLDLKFEHPFYYAIVDDASGTVLMNGHYLASGVEKAKAGVKLPRALFKAPEPYQPKSAFGSSERSIMIGKHKKR